MSLWSSFGLVTAFILLGIGVFFLPIVIADVKDKSSTMIEGLFMPIGLMMISLFIFVNVYDDIPNHFSSIIGVFSDEGIVTTLVGAAIVFILIILATFVIIFYSISSDGYEILMDQYNFNNLVAFPKYNSNIFITFGLLILFLGILAWSAFNRPESLVVGLRLFSNPLCCGLLLFSPLMLFAFIVTKLASSSQVDSSDS